MKLEKMSFKELYDKASELWRDKWLMQSVELTDITSDSEDFCPNVEGIYHYITVDEQPNFILEADPEIALRKAIEKWGDREPSHEKSPRKKKILKDLDCREKEQ